MQLFVLGATGNTGRACVRLALARGHRVTALVRDPAALAPHDGLTIVAGSAVASSDVRDALGDAEAVISALGHRSLRGGTLLRDAATAILGAFAATQPRRYVVISQGLLFPSRNPAVAIVRFVLRRLVDDSAAMEAVVTASNVDYTVARPPRLVAGKPAGAYRALADALPKGALQMTFDDLALFLVDAAETGRYPREIVGVGPP